MSLPCHVLEIGSLISMSHSCDLFSLVSPLEARIIRYWCTHWKTVIKVRSQPLQTPPSPECNLLLFFNSVEPLERYTGHQAMVSCVIYQHGNLISASWDR